MDYPGFTEDVTAYQLFDPVNVPGSSVATCLFLDAIAMYAFPSDPVFTIVYPDGAVPMASYPWTIASQRFRSPPHAAVCDGGLASLVPDEFTPELKLMSAAPLMRTRTAPHSDVPDMLADMLAPSDPSAVLENRAALLWEVTAVGMTLYLSVNPLGAEIVRALPETTEAANTRMSPVLPAGVVTLAVDPVFPPLLLPTMVGYGFPAKTGIGEKKATITASPERPEANLCRLRTRGT